MLFQKSSFFSQSRRSLGLFERLDTRRLVFTPDCNSLVVVTLWSDFRTPERSAVGVEDARLVPKFSVKRHDAKRMCKSTSFNMTT